MSKSCTVFVMTSLLVTSMMGFSPSIQPNTSTVENVFTTNVYAGMLGFDYRYLAGLNTSIRDASIHQPSGEKKIVFKTPNGNEQINSDYLKTADTLDDTYFSVQPSDNFDRMAKVLSKKISISATALSKYKNLDNFDIKAVNYEGFDKTKSTYLDITVNDFSRGVNIFELFDLSYVDLIELNPGQHGYRLDLVQLPNSDVKDVYILPKASNPGRLELLISDTLLVTISSSEDAVTPVTYSDTGRNIIVSPLEDRVEDNLNSSVVDDKLTNVTPPIEDLSGTGQVTNPDTTPPVVNPSTGSFSDDGFGFTEEQINNALTDTPALNIPDNIADIPSTSDGSGKEGYWKSVTEGTIGGLNTENVGRDPATDKVDDSDITTTITDESISTGNTSSGIDVASGTDVFGDVVVAKDKNSTKNSTTSNVLPPVKKTLDTTMIELDPIRWGVSYRDGSTMSEVTKNGDDILKDVVDEMDMNITNLTGRDYEFVQKKAAKLQTITPIQPTPVQHQESDIFLSLVCFAASLVFIFLYFILVNRYIYVTKKEISKRELASEGIIQVDSTTESLQGFEIK